MTEHNIKRALPSVVTLLIGLFFLFILHFRISYTLIPILLAVIGLGVLFSSRKQTRWEWIHTDKWLIGAFVVYFLLALLSFVVHQGKARELDLPAKLLLSLPILAIFTHLTLKVRWILYAIVSSTFIAGIVGISRAFLFHQVELFPAHMMIQAGGIVMSMSLFCTATAFYFKRHRYLKWFGFSLLACVVGVIACLLNQTRGAWVLSPLILLLVLWLNRDLVSKWLVIGLVSVGLVGGLLAGQVVQKRVLEAKSEIAQYIEENNGSTSVGARLDMWKSALIGIQEKPLLGWGNGGKMRQAHFEQGLISEYAASFGHAHNQYLHEAANKGLLGLVGLLALFFIPLYFSWQAIKTSEKNDIRYLWGILGVIHILGVMGYSLTQSFLAHNSGIMFYSFGCIVFYGLQKSALIASSIHRER